MIYAIGDSFTYGDELATQDSAWPAVLGNMLDKKVANQGKPASGNNRMVKRAIDAAIDNAEMIVIGWSDCNRQEFADEIGIYDIWAGRNAAAFQLQDPTHRVNLIKYLTTHDTPGYYYAQWLRQIILVQSLCKLKKIPCVMFIACGSHVSNRLYSPLFQRLIKEIDHNMFVEDMFTSVGEWCYGLPYGPNGHPLEAGHQLIAEKIYNHVKSICPVF